MDKKYKLTQEGIERFKAEYEKQKVLRDENIIAIQEAKSQGDLSENADYSSAREVQRDIAAKIKELEEILNNYEPIVLTDENNLGKYITFRFLDENEEETYQLVGTIEADPLQNRFSDVSPLGKASFTAKAGQTVRYKTDDDEQHDVLIVKISKKKN